MNKRTFLITGASKGIGLSLAQALSNAGHRVVGIARHVEGVDFPGTLVSVDLGDRKATEQALATLAQHHSFDGLVNNVGLVRPQLLGEVDLDDFDAVMRVNLHSALLATQALLPGMRERQLGTGAGHNRYHRQRRCPWADRDRAVSREQSSRQRR